MAPASTTWMLLFMRSSAPILLSVSPSASYVALQTSLTSTSVLTTFTLQAAKDDVIPLSVPLRTPTGDLVDRITITAGEEVIVPISYMNTAVAFWGPDAHEFRPERWLLEDGLPKKAQEVQGHRHLLTFVDGHRMCLGRGFALAEFKVRVLPTDEMITTSPLYCFPILTMSYFRDVLTISLNAQAVLGVLIKNYRFELPDGPETKLEHCRGVLPRPRVVGQKGANVPMRVRRVD